MARHCASCGAALGERGAFCHRCGAPRNGRAAAAPAPAPAAAAATATATATATAGMNAATILPWAVAGISLLALIAFVVGQRFGRAPVPSVAAGAVPTVAAAGGRAPDISQMSPQERADRLFFRVMTYVSEGKSDSVSFFSPMAIQSFEALAPLDAHQRYDLGLLGVVSGDGQMARAQADTILATQPTHLLGLILGMRASGLMGDAPARAEYAARLSSALVTERAKQLPEYDDHAPDIDAALREADNATVQRR